MALASNSPLLWRVGSKK
uniref:Uncharacterized protein n=1 Tax=Anguilla anguilla TaxID=7936 RepID=A0A0E9R332_ANGAN